jgi:hypothetical protein
MRLTIIKADNTVGLDGEFLTVDCAALPADFHALQWEGPEDGIGGEGEAEWTGKPKPANTEVIDLGDYYAYVEAWRTEKARIEAELEAERSVPIKTPTPVEILP